MHEPLRITVPWASYPKILRCTSTRVARRAFELKQWQSWAYGNVSCDFLQERSGAKWRYSILVLRTSCLRLCCLRLRGQETANAAFWHFCRAFDGPGRGRHRNDSRIERGQRVWRAWGSGRCRPASPSRAWAFWHGRARTEEWQQGVVSVSKQRLWWAVVALHRNSHASVPTPSWAFHTYCTLLLITDPSLIMRWFDLVWNLKFIVYTDCMQCSTIWSI